MTEIRSKPLALLQFDLSTTRGRDRFDFWHALGSPTYNTLGRPEWREAIDVRSSTWSHGSASLSRFAATPFTVIRREPEIAAEPGAVLKIKLYEYGTTWLLHSGATTVLGSSEVHIIDQSRERSEISTARENLTFVIPHKIIGYDPARHPICRSLPVGRGEGAVLAECIRALEGAVSVDPTASHDKQIAGIVAVLGNIISRHEDASTGLALAEARALAMQHFVRRHALSDPPGVVELGRRFHCSRAGVYRAFEKHGGVNRFIQTCRLDVAFAALSAAPEQRGIVSETGDMLGFYSTSHFSHAFKQRFGLRPSEVVGAAAPTERTGAAGVAREMADVSGRVDTTASLAAFYSRFQPLRVHPGASTNPLQPQRSETGTLRFWCKDCIRQTRRLHRSG